MTKNRGHARCNAFGIRHIFNNKIFDNLILMDGDGEDRPIEIKNLIDKMIKNPSLSVVAKRVKRSEGIFFQLLYQIHKLITLVFTGKKLILVIIVLLQKAMLKKFTQKLVYGAVFLELLKKI